MTLCDNGVCWVGRRRRGEDVSNVIAVVVLCLHRQGIQYSSYELVLFCISAPVTTVRCLVGHLLDLVVGCRDAHAMTPSQAGHQTHAHRKLAIRSWLEAHVHWHTRAPHAHDA